MSLNVFKDSISNYPRWALWRRTKCFFKSIKMAWQRATRGYCDWDVYDLDCFYRELIINSLTQFRENLLGAPCDFSTMEGKHERKEEIDDFVLWKEYIGDIIYCLQMSDEDYEFGLKNKYEDEYFHLLFKNEETTKEHFELFEAYWQEEQKLNNKRHEYLEEGLSLLARYFEHLWD